MAVFKDSEPTDEVESLEEARERSERNKARLRTISESAALALEATFDERTSRSEGSSRGRHQR